MMFLIYDTAKHEIPGLISLKKQFSKHDMLLNKCYDGDLEYVAPWIFQIAEEELHALKSLNIDAQEMLWFDSKASLIDIIRVFQNIIYNNDPRNAKQFFRIWDIQILVQELSKQNDNPVFKLFEVIDNIYLLNDEMMKMYYLDFWGVLNNKTLKNIIPQSSVCHSQLQE